MSTTHPCYALSFEDRPNPYISEQKENKIKDKKIAEPCLKIYLRLEGSGEKFSTPGNFHSLNQDSLDFYGITFTSLKDKKIIIISSYYYYVFFIIILSFAVALPFTHTGVFLFAIIIIIYQWDQNMEQSFKNRVAAAAREYCAKAQCFPNQSR